ncbi:hypothetical protein [Nocardioides rubriscoriae]|uniref:hypothetical protein n=1 Tax=Nocardioides rubriscoriae TaxID=642762 RepID=UPI0011DF610D|nr:hypothetical protein [Nocardioides rubriscoriae]
MARPLTPQGILDLAARLPADRPYTAAEADRRGVNTHHRRLLIRSGMIVSRLKGTFHAAGLKDTLELRVAILRLVVPADCVVTDRTAAWLWGAAMALAPGDHLEVPKVSVFAPPGRRLRNELARSGERQLAGQDVVELGGLRVTTPLRTACDVLRLLHRDQALAAADALAALQQFTVDELVSELLRFKGYRHVVQARTLAPLVDHRSQSAMESTSRLRWHDAGLPRPECQVVEVAPDGGWCAVDIGLPEDRFGLEYFGEEWHGEAQEDHDEARLEWLREERRWTLVVARKHHVLGPRQDLVPRLQATWNLHRARSRRPVA